MAIDHFVRYKEHVKRTDWNFNILFNDQPQLAELVSKYETLLQHSGLHNPISVQWLHATVLRAGFLEEFSDDEMLAVAKKLEPKLASMKMPQLMLGQWWIWNGGPVLHITPDQQLNELFEQLVESLMEIVGEQRLPKKLQFIPHVTLAYPKTYDDELGLYRQLQANPIEGINVRATNLSLLKQHVEDDYYAWKIIKDIPIGQAI
jgi:2'-5' RNA ligase